MKVKAVVCSVVFGLASAVFAGEVTVPVLSYDSAEACRGTMFNSWGGDKKGRAFWDSEAKGLHLVWTNSVGAFVLGRDLARAVPAALTNAPGVLRHVRVRVAANGFTSPLSLRFQTADGVYEHPMGVDPNGRDSVAFVRPGGFSHSKRRFVWQDMRTLQFYASGGSGDYVLKDIAFVFDTTPRPAPEPVVAADEFRLFPLPRVFRAGTDVWPLSAYAAPKGCGVGSETPVTWMTNRVHRFFGESFAAWDGRPLIFALAGTPEGREALGRLKLLRNFDRVKFDGYALAVRADGIDVVAANEMGLMNGARALMETIHLATGDVGPAQARAVTVVDWPRLGNRLFYTPLASGKVVGGAPGPEVLDGLLERFVHSAHMNLVSLDLGPLYKYVCDPKSGYEPGAWTPDELTNMIDRINAVGVKAVPFFMSPGHQWPNLLHGCRNMHLSENGSCEALCLKHPETYPAVFAHMDEIAGTCSHNPRYKADIFYTGGDEVRWPDRDKKGEECPRCRGIPRNRLLLEHNRRVDAWCRAHGYQMLMCSDMYSSQQSGYNRFLGARIADDLPKSIGLVHWASLSWDELPLWRRRGHDNWRIMTAYSDDPVAQDGIVGNGIAMYMDRWWLSYSRTGASGGYSPLAIAFAGADGWGEPPRCTDTLSGRAEAWGNCLMRRWSRKPIPRAARGFAPVDLTEAANRDVVTRHGFATKDLVGVPCAFARAADGIRAVAADGAEHVVKVGRRASSLVFLHTGHLADEDVKAFKDRKFNQGWLFGAPIATWRVTYADGTVEPFVVRYGWNVGERDAHAPGHHAVFGRFIGDARFAWTDADGQTAYSHEWVNPHPEKAIVSLTLERKPTMVGYELWSLTTRAARLGI